MQWMIYGANGYSAQLIAREAIKRGLTPVLAARNRQKVKSIAEELHLDFKVFSLDDIDTAATALADVEAVIHCAGPFAATSTAMIEACLLSKTHYFDITGEIDVFEHAHSDSINKRAQEKGILVCPGIGFDVIPTDCIALTLSNAMPDATHLALGFDCNVKISPGTAKTSVEGMAQGSKSRVDGILRSCFIAHKTRHIDFGRGEKTAMTIPWGDISTAYKTTGIPNIDTYIPTKSWTVPLIRLSRFITPLFNITAVQHLIKKLIDKKVDGPSESARNTTRAWVWGEVKNSNGDIKQATVETPNPYTVTIHGPLAIIQALPTLTLLTQTGAGSITPALLMGADFISQLPDTSEITIF